MSNLEDFKLCYIEGDIAYFTTCPIDKQWGDDWNDAPYEHNAGAPYEWAEYMRKHDKEPYEIKKLSFSSRLETPSRLAYGGNSRFSVEDINSGKTPWLQTEDWEKEKVTIMANISIPEFISAIQKDNGTIFIPYEEAELYTRVL